MARLFVIFLFSALAFPKEVVWIRIEPQFSYKDISVFCSNAQSLSSHYLAAEVEGSQVVRAVLREGTSPGTSASLSLQQEDLGALVLSKDREDAWRIKSLRLSRTLIEWFFFRSSVSGNCRPPMALRRIEPLPVGYEFDLSSSESSESNHVHYSGERKDGAAFEARLFFKQKPLNH